MKLGPHVHIGLGCSVVVELCCSALTLELGGCYEGNAGQAFVI